jgi:molecular chaperone DnaK
LRELVDARNQADSLLHTVRKTLKENEGKIDAGDKDKIDAAAKELEEAIKSDDIEVIKNKSESLMQASHKLAEQMYAKAGGGAAGAAGNGAEADTQAKAGTKENVVDAEFEEVKDEKRAK